MSPLVLTEPVRQLSAADLGLAPGNQGRAAPEAPESDEFVIAEDDPLLDTVLGLLDSYGGVIFTGPPGTSKTHVAQAIGRRLTEGDPKLLRLVQFHPSYQYEDFVEGYVPNPDTGSFLLTPKHLLQMCAVAEANPARTAVLVIDELSRGEPGRIFGEALTYVERTRRGQEFHLASGNTLIIPENLVFLCTMNPLDRGVDEVDAAFERRFAKVSMEPSVERLREFLDEAGMDPTLRDRVVGFFRRVNKENAENPFGAVGHTYFLGVADEGDLRRLWEHQLSFLFKKAYQFDANGLRAVERGWQMVFDQSDAEAGAAELQVAVEGEVTEVQPGTKRSD